MCSGRPGTVTSHAAQQLHGQHIAKHRGPFEHGILKTCYGTFGPCFASGLVGLSGRNIKASGWGIHASYMEVK